MSSRGNDPASGRGRRRRWIIAAAVFLAAAVALGVYSSRNSVAARARQIHIGQPRDEVIRLMGQPQISYTAGPLGAGECYTEMSSIELTLRMLISQFFGVNALPALEDYGVDLQYDSNRCVSRIRIDGELVDR